MTVFVVVIPNMIFIFGSRNKKEMKCKGVICCSGYGDGYYSVYGFKNENKYTYLRLEF